MGDSGAMFLGLLLSAAAITLTGQIDLNAITNQGSSSPFLPLLLPFSILAIPLIDLGMAVIRRLRAGRSPFAADKEHLHHKLLSMGNSHRRTSAILYSWTAMFAFPTTIAAFAPLWLALLTGLLILIFSLVLLTNWPNRNKQLIKVG
jgi:UDP-GlcNAc:undecaprenyl-phosphate GlcNAc-1-phosphate transferase